MNQDGTFYEFWVSDWNGNSNSLSFGNLFKKIGECVLPSEGVTEPWNQQNFVMLWFLVQGANGFKLILYSSFQLETQVKY